MKILVTGGSSQIGFFCLPLLAQAGHAVLGVSRAGQAGIDGVTWIQADLQTPSALSGCKATALIHLAGIPLLPSLLEILPDTLERVIAFSSTSRFSKADSSSAAERAIAARLARAEQEVIALCERRGLAWTIFRPTLVYGCGRDQNISFIARMVRRFGFFPLLGDGRGLRQPVHAQDLALACLQALAKAETYGQSYDLSGGETLSYRDMVAAVFAAQGKPPRLVSVPAGLLLPAIAILNKLPPFRHVSVSMLERMARDLCFDHSAARRDFGYAPRPFRGTDPGA